jgi:hypothetical protein
METTPLYESLPETTRSDFLYECSPDSFVLSEIYDVMRENYLCKFLCLGYKRGSVLLSRG